MSGRRAARSAPAECAVCGEVIPRGAKACPQCGADERTGWREASIYDGLDLPGEAYDESGAHSDRSESGLKWYWLAAAMLVLLTLGFMVLGLR